MRKLKLQIQLSLDGFIAGKNGEMDWMLQNWDDGLNSFVGALTHPVDCILLGRKLAEGFIPYWESVADDLENPEQPSGKKFTETEKIVFSHTLQNIPGTNVSVAKDDLATVVKSLKAADGGDIIAYGGGNFVSNLIKENLIDEYHLFISPIAIGNGMTIFADLTHSTSLTLVETRAFSCGIALLSYRAINH